MSSWVRAPAVAGLFYPGDASTLRAAVESYLVPGAGDAAPKALIAPHAGYVYSGPTAGFAYGLVAPLRDRVRRVLLAGPAHRVPLDGVGVSSASGFETPLGVVPIDDEARSVALAVDGVSVADDAHRPEHSLEVHLPFLQAVLEDFAVLPLVVGRRGVDVLAHVFEQLWGGDETLVVVSTDLSHYHDHATAQALDARTAAAIVDGRADDIDWSDACGAGPVRGLLTCAPAAALRTTMLDLRTSADTAGDPDRVVGYGAFALTP